MNRPNKLDCSITQLERLTSVKHSNVLVQFLSYEENWMVVNAAPDPNWPHPAISYPFTKELHAPATNLTETIIEWQRIRWDHSGPNSGVLPGRKEQVEQHRRGGNGDKLFSSSLRGPKNKAWPVQTYYNHHMTINLRVMRLLTDRTLTDSTTHRQWQLTDRWKYDNSPTTTHLYDNSPTAIIYCTKTPHRQLRDLPTLEVRTRERELSKSYVLSVSCPSISWHVRKSSVGE